MARPKSPSKAIASRTSSGKPLSKRENGGKQQVIRQKTISRSH